MAKQKILFIDRDGTLIQEPDDFQVDSLDKLALVPHVVPSLLALKAGGYCFVMVSNQDGLGTASFPEDQFRLPHEAMMRLFSSQGIEFEDVLICPHMPSDLCACRKPSLGLMKDYLSRSDWDRKRSYVIGDRETDLQLASHMGIEGFLFGHHGQGTLDWREITTEILSTQRKAQVVRKTNETSVRVAVDLSGTGKACVTTGIGFFDHMLEQLSRHGGFDMDVAVEGDLDVDAHHTVEDTALALGAVLREALGDKVGICRYGFLLPMDESLARIALDLAGRPFLVFSGEFPSAKVGALDCELVSHFWHSWCQGLGATLHIEVHGQNSHHMIEAVFKGVGRALRQALASSGDGLLPSTKGSL